MIGIPRSIEEFYIIAADIQKNLESGVSIDKVIVPKQELEPENATVFLKVIDGFIERVDLSNTSNAKLEHFLILNLLLKERL